MIQKSEIITDGKTLSKIALGTHTFHIETEKTNFEILENGKKYSCQMYVNPNHDSKNIKKGDVLNLTGNFKKFVDKEGTEKFNFSVSKLEKNTAQGQPKEVEQSR